MKTFKEFKLLSEEVKTVAPLWQRKGKVFPLNPGKWKSEWKNKYNVEFIKIEKFKKRMGKNIVIDTHVYVKGEEEDLANWFMKVFAKQPGLSVPLFKSASKTLDMVKDADDNRRFSFSSQI